MIKSSHFIAELKYRSAQEGGRKTPAASGYRPQVKFGFEKMQTSGHQKFIGTELVYPGETVMAEITVLSPQLFEGKLEVGMQFEFREGLTVIGTGKIMDITNKILERKEASN